MRIESVIVFSQDGNASIDLSNYDEIKDNSLEFESSICVFIDCYKSGKLVRRFINPSCDIRYSE
jgi:hypothetical protein